MLKRSLVLLMLLPAGAIAADTSSRIESVTVYPQGALLTRVASVSLSSGDNSIRLTGLDDGIDPQFMQVAVADARVSIGQVRLSREQARNAARDEIVALENAIAAKQLEIQAVDDSTAGADLRLKFLDGIAAGYSRETVNDGGTLSVDSLQQVLGLLQRGAETAGELKRGNGKKRAELQKDLSLLQRELNDLRGGGLQSTAIDVTLGAAQSTQTELRITYFQYGAGWNPVYEARLDSESGRLTLLQQAEVRQRTAQPWTNVRLTLSTSRPSGRLEAPELSPEFINIRKPVPQADALRENEFRDRKLTMAAQDRAEEIIVTANRVTPTIGNFATSFDIPGRTSIPNDVDEAVTLDLSSFTTSTELVTRVVPRQSTEAYLTARFTYEEDLPLFASSVRIYVDGVYSGNAAMPEVMPGASVMLPMGQDRRLVVKSESQGGKDSESGILSRRKIEKTDYLFEITNRRSKPTVVEVLDRVPVSRNSEIDVEVPRTATSPSERDIDDKPGLLLWQNTLDGGETWQIRHQYTVSYPSDEAIVRE